MGGGFVQSSRKQLQANKPAKMLCWGSPAVAACHPPAVKGAFLQMNLGWSNKACQEH